MNDKEKDAAIEKLEKEKLRLEKNILDSTNQIKEIHKLTDEFILKKHTENIIPIDSKRKTLKG